MSQRVTQATTTGERTIEILRGETPKTFEDAQALLPRERPAPDEDPELEAEEEVAATE
ncbi:MAG TPA: hypothetical protein VGQ58_07155 [Candidatus Limnocylindrales bacterium]|jgi:hypothetical protein|nr:hypothetical protein [Candidatus Limnocylindrales bacterium]